VLVSSAVVYGPAREAPYREDEAPRPAGPFAAAKRAAEVRAAERHGRVTCLRIGALYGPGHPPLTPFGRDPSLFDKLRRGLPLPVPAGAGPLQPWFAGDHGRLVADVLRDPDPPAVLNAAGPERLDWAALLAAWADAAGAPPPVIDVRPASDLRASAPAALAPFLDALWGPQTLDVTRLAARFERPTPFAEGARRTLAAG
jgi:nucleoside-diphosphate-sugar epimerase